MVRDASSGFTARALTRDVNSDKAKELAKLGAEVVATDVDDVDSLKRASKGAYGAFCVTFFWAHFSPEKELAQATAMANAAKHAEARHLVHAGRHTPVGSTEALQLMKAIWTTDPVEFNGKYYQIPRSYIGPKPIQNF
jgi:uncharacterized protein YbjT (DUF2867 family)